MQNRDEEAATAEVDEDQLAANIANEQAAHSSNIARIVYAREITERVGEVAERWIRFQQNSQEWHQFLRFPSAILTLPKHTITPFQD